MIRQIDRQEWLMACILLHDGRERRADGGDTPCQEADDVGEEVVRHLRTALQVDDPLVVVAAFVGRTPVIMI